MLQKTHTSVVDYPCHPTPCWLFPWKWIVKDLGTKKGYPQNRRVDYQTICYLCFCIFLSMVLHRLHGQAQNRCIRILKKYRTYKNYILIGHIINIFKNICGIYCNALSKNRSIPEYTEFPFWAMITITKIGEIIQVRSMSLQYHLLNFFLCGL